MPKICRGHKNASRSGIYMLAWNKKSQTPGYDTIPRHTLMYVDRGMMREIEEGQSLLKHLQLVTAFC